MTTMLFAVCGLAAAQGQRIGSRAQTATPTTSTSQPQQPQQSQQSQPPQPSGEQSADVPTDTADLAITAHVTARELRFETVPNPQVEFTGQPGRETQWGAVRENLPRPVQPGVTYRNIGIRLKIVSVFADIDRIVAEALGEVPIKDELPAEKSAPENNAPENNGPENNAPERNSSQRLAPLPASSTNGQTGARP
jgi:hypothetical protein